MGSNDLHRQRVRSRRVARIRKRLVGSLVAVLTVLLIVCIVLSYFVFSLNKKVSGLEKRIDTLEAVASADAQGRVNFQERFDGDYGDINASLATVDGNSDASGEYGIDAHQDIYLTFDDGPSDNTEKILDILDEYDVKATFFVVGTSVQKYKDMCKEIVDRGHVLAMHSYTHKYSSLYESSDSFKKEIKKEQKLLEKLTGVKPWLFRFPGGSSNEVSNVPMADLISYLNSEDITYFDWNVTGGDATSQSYTKKSVIKTVMADIGKHKTAVVLLHDTNAKMNTVAALPVLIETLQKRDATLKAIDKDTPLVQHVSSDSVK